MGDLLRSMHAAILWTFNVIRRASGLSTYNATELGVRTGVLTMDIPGNPLRIALFIYEASIGSSVRITMTIGTATVFLDQFLVQNQMVIEFIRHGDMVYLPMTIEATGGDITVIERIKAS